MGYNRRSNRRYAHRVARRRRFVSFIMGEQMVDSSNEIALFQPDEEVRLEVLLDEETVWLTQAQMVELFQSSKANVSEHIKHVFDEGELEESSTVRNFRTVQLEGRRNVARKIEHYNLDVIISVGYRVKSKRGTQFRIWATGVLKEYLLRGYAVNQRVERLVDKMGTVLDKMGTVRQNGDGSILSSNSKTKWGRQTV